jgi:hypothetical protein
VEADIGDCVSRGRDLRFFDVAEVQDLKQIEEGLEALRHRPVQISVVDDFSAIPAGIARAVDPDMAMAIPRPRAPDSSEPDPPVTLHSRRRPRWLGSIVVDGAAALAAAGTLAPGAIDHGSAQVLLVGVGGALVGTLSARLMDRTSKWFDRAAEGRATS